MVFINLINAHIAVIKCCTFHFRLSRFCGHSRPTGIFTSQTSEVKIIFSTPALDGLITDYRFPNPGFKLLLKASRKNYANLPLL